MVDVTEMYEENFPQELKDRNQWVLYQLKPVFDKDGNRVFNEDGKPKFTKVPKKPDGFDAKSNQPQTWSSFDTVKEAYSFSNIAFDGYGYVFSADDPYIGIDLDNCINSDGSYSEVATDFLNQIPGYAEKSPSGNGLHIISRGDIHKRDIKEYTDGTKKKTLFEIYKERQFFTMTGDTINCHGQIPDTPQDVYPVVKKYSQQTSSQEIVLSDDSFENYKSKLHDWDSEKIQKELLNNIDPDISYPDWVQVGMALHHQYRGSDEGLSLFNDWSMRGSKYQSGECERRWDSFDHKRDNTITLASLIKLYKKQQKEKIIEQRRADAGPLKWANLSSLIYKDPPPRRWVVEDWIPDAATTSFYGKGGIGKSILMQQLAVAVATGTPFLGIEVTKGPVIGYFCEEDNDEILRRAKGIFDELMFDLNECPELDDLYLAGRAGFPNIFAYFENDSSHSTTPDYDEFEKAVATIRPRLIILDNISQIFGGNEIMRNHVTPFVNIITNVAKKYNCAVVMVGHVAKVEGSQFSGSTAFDAAVRTRLLLNRNDDGTTTFLKAKSNLAKEDEVTIELRNTVFKTVTPEDKEKAKKILVGQIKQFIRDKTKQKEQTSNKSNSRTNVINLMVKEEVISANKKKLGKEVLADLIKNDEILPDEDLGWKNASRTPVKGLKINE